MNKPELKLGLIAPVFAVADIKRTKDYYTDKLGFDIDFEWADHEGDPIRYISVGKNDRHLHFSQSGNPHKAMAYFFIDDVENYYKAVKESGADVTKDLKDWPWEMREFEVADPDGNRLIFGQDISQDISGE